MKCGSPLPLWGPQPSAVGVGDGGFHPETPSIKSQAFQGPDARGLAPKKRQGAAALRSGLATALLHPETPSIKKPGAPRSGRQWAGSEKAAGGCRTPKISVRSADFLTSHSPRPFPASRGERPGLSCYFIFLAVAPYRFWGPNTLPKLISTTTKPAQGKTSCSPRLMRIAG